MTWIERRYGAVRVVCTDRGGGVSEAPFDTANLALHVGDDPDAVVENRRRSAAVIGGPAGDADAWVWLDQVHGATVVDAVGSDVRGATGDAAVTATAGIALVVMVADCAPVALVGERAVGVVHAGWRGLVAGVVEEAVASMRKYDDGPLHALVGPCIHPASYEFSHDDLDVVARRLGPSVRGRTRDGAPALDVPSAVAAALRGAGVEGVEDVGVCTAESPHHFSHRRDGPTGRQAMVVVREASVASPVPPRAASAARATGRRRRRERQQDE